MAADEALLAALPRRLAFEIEEGRGILNHGEKGEEDERGPRSKSDILHIQATHSLTPSTTKHICLSSSHDRGESETLVSSSPPPLQKKKKQSGSDAAMVSHVARQKWDNRQTKNCS